MTDQNMSHDEEQILDSLLDRYEKAKSVGEEFCLEAECAHAPHLVQIARDQIRALDRADQLLETCGQNKEPTVERSAHGSESMSASSSDGSYRLESLIAAGGMGEVWRAQQVRPIRRQVAIKLIRKDYASDRLRARFSVEQQALAMMEHPNIAKMFDAGTTDTGEPFFVMELVEGQPITKFCDQQRMTTSQRVELVADICEAVQHAHRRGVLHRDIKPSNVLVANYEGRFVPKVIDFGLAKAVSAENRLNDSSMQTELGQPIGTVLYMSPEQAALDAPADIDTRSDVYSLGVLLYELLVGTPPVSPEFLATKGLLATLREIREAEVTLPSARLAKLTDTQPEVVACRQTDCGRLQQELKRDLDWIVHKALAKSREMRYGSASELAADLRASLRNEPISARSPTFIYRARKFYRRNRAAAIAITAVFVMLVLSTAVSLGFGINANRQKAIAQDEARRADENMSRALKSLDLMWRRVAQRMSMAPDTDFAERQEILADTIALYRGLMTDNPTNNEVIERNIHILHQIANLQLMLGDRDKALEEISAALKLDKQLHLDGSSTADQERRAMLINLLGAIRHYYTDGDTAVGEFSQAIRLNRSLLAQERENPLRKHNLGAALYNSSTSILRISKSEADLQRGLKQMEEAIALFEDLYESDNKDLRAIAGLGQSLQMGARYHRALRQPQERRKLLLRSVEILEQAAGEHPIHQIQAAFGNSLSDLGSAIYMDGGDENVAEGKRYWYRAATQYQHVFNENPQIQESAYILSQILYNISLAEEDGSAEQKAVIERGVSVLTDIQSRFPEVEKYAMEAIALRRRLAEWHVQNDEFETAVRIYQQALEECEPIIQRHANETHFAKIYKLLLRFYGNCLDEMGENHAALDVYMRCISFIEKHYGTTPVEPAFFDTLKGAYSDLADVLEEEGRMEEACAARRRAVELDPDDTECQSLYGLCLARLGETENALAIAMDLADADVVSGEAYDTACAIALCIAHGEDNSAGVLTQRAVTELKRALKLGYFAGTEDLEHLQSDSDLDSIREHKAFQELVETIRIAIGSQPTNSADEPTKDCQS